MSWLRLMPSLLGSWLSRMFEDTEVQLYLDEIQVVNITTFLFFISMYSTPGNLSTLLHQAV